MKRKKKVRVLPPPQAAVNPMRAFPFDPMGSYTGVTEMPDEVPVQDADDL